MTEKTTKKSVYLIGVGGIGSWMTQFLRYYADREQLNEMDLTIVDPDIVEKKNLMYSNFLSEDIGKPKAEVLSKRYKFNYKLDKITKQSQLDKVDIIVLAVDNSQARDLVYKSEHFWIDCRSKGMGYSVFFKSKQTKNNTLNLKRAAESCQYENRLVEGLIDNGNVISAIMGVSQILNYFRGTLSVNEIIGMI